MEALYSSMMPCTRSTSPSQGPSPGFGTANSRLVTEQMCSRSQPGLSLLGGSEQREEPLG